MAGEDNINPAQFPHFDPTNANYNHTAYDYHGPDYGDEHANARAAADRVKKERGWTDRSWLAEDETPEIREDALEGLHESQPFHPNKTHWPN